MPSSTQCQETVPVGKFVKVMSIQSPAGAGVLPQPIEIDGGPGGGDDVELSVAMVFELTPSAVT